MIYGFILIRQIFADNTKFEESEVYVFVPTDANYEQVQKIVAPYVEDMNRFDVVANKKSYPANVKSGRVFLKKCINYLIKYTICQKKLRFLKFSNLRYSIHISTQNQEVGCRYQRYSCPHSLLV